MEKISEVNKAINLTHAQLFDIIETRDIRETIWALRERVLGRFFSHIKEREEARFKLEKEQEDKFLEEAMKELEFFLRTLNPQILDEQGFQKQEIQAVGIAKGQEIIFRAIDNGIESKRVFKELIIQVSEQFNLDKESVNYLKSVVIEFVIIREKVNNFYSSFAGNIELISQFLLGKNILNEKGVEIRKGPFGVEFFVPENIFKKIYNKNEAGGVNFGFQNLVFRNMVDFERPGGIFNIILVKTNSEKTDKTTEEIVTHERQHARFHFMKKSSERLIPRNQNLNLPQDLEMYGRLIGNPVETEIYFKKVLRFYLKNLDFHYKNEFLAQISIYKPEDLENGLAQLMIGYDYRSFYKSLFEEELKSKANLNYSLDNDQLETIARWAYYEYIEMIQNSCKEFIKLIQKYPSKREFFVVYFTNIKISEWPEHIDKLAFLTPEI